MSTNKGIEKRPPSPDAEVYRRYQYDYKWKPEDPRWTPHDAPAGATSWEFTDLQGGLPDCPHEYPAENTWVAPEKTIARLEKVCIRCGLIVGVYDDWKH